MKGKTILKFISTILITTFIFSYVIEKSGYYEYNLQSRKNLTEKEIKEFEQDVKDGKDIDIKDYMHNDTTDYSNNLTKATSNMSIKLNNYIKLVLTDSFNIFEKLVK